MREKLIKNMGYLIVLLDIAIFFVLSYVFVEDFNTNILATVVNGSLLFIGAVIATNALMKQGILRGRDNKEYKDTLAAHITQKQKIYPKIKYLQPWLNKDYYGLMKIGRTVYVNSAGFDYTELFTEEGKVIPEKKIEKPTAVTYTTTFQKATAWIRKLTRWMFSDEWRIYRQRKNFVKKAKRYHVTRQTVSYLLNIDEEKDPNNFGITERQYTKAQSGLNIASRLIFSILLQSISFGFYGFNMETLLTQTLSVSLILISAFFAMYNAYFFMVKTHRETIIKKINKLEEFDNADTSCFINQEKEIENEEDVINEIHAEIPGTCESQVVEEVCGNGEHRESSDLCGNSNTGL